MYQEKNLNSRKLRDNLKYLFYFYKYLFTEQSLEIFVFAIINFFLGLAPIILVTLFEIMTKDYNLLKQFLGDGSIVIFCFGVLVSFVTIKIPDFSGGHNNRLKQLLLISLSVIYYLTAFFIFEKAQTNFNKTWSFILWINLTSFLMLLIAFLIVTYVQFSSKYDYSIINPYREKLVANHKAKKASKKDTTDENNIDEKLKL